MSTVIVYRLSDDLAQHPEEITLAQALTLDADSPDMGLKGSRGLFGSAEWWENIRTGVLPSKRRSGIIQDAYPAGQDSTKLVGEIIIACDNGILWTEGVFTTSDTYIKLYKIGNYIDILYALDEMKEKLPDGSHDILEIPLEISITPHKD